MAAGLLFATVAAAQQTLGPRLSGGDEFVGLWQATRTFGPEIKGTLLLVERDGGLWADIAGFSVPVPGVPRNSASSVALEFALPDNKGSFRGKRVGDEIHGFWIQPTGLALGWILSTPVTLRKQGEHWRGEVRAREDRFSYYLPITRSADGSLATYLRNPDRNDGIFTQVKSFVVEGDTVKLVGNRRGRKDSQALYEGRKTDGGFTIESSGRGGSFDFHRVDADASNAFYPRGRSPLPYKYAKPLQLDDGWPTATLEDVGLDRATIEAFVRKIVERPMTDVSTSQIHAVLIARHGKLVLEEYFHGHHRALPHDERSAGKSLLATLVGAAIEAGIPVSADTPVYETMLGKLPADIDPRKRAMRLENLLTMTGGHYCDDSDPNAPGNEDTMEEQQKERDWYRYILALPMDRVPGEKIIYCSIDPHLGGGVLSKVAGEPLVELFDRLIARPLRFGTYHLNLAPTGVAYFGGGQQLLARDFLKVAQLMLNEGTWAGKRIVSRDWALKSTASLRNLTPQQQYGYLWNAVEYPYRGRKVRAFFAAGNGGQIFMGIPELDLAIGFNGGNYADASLFIPQRKLVPEEILPALKLP